MNNPVLLTSHARQRIDIRRRLYERGRSSAADRGYGADWRKRRIVGLAREPLCRECKKAGKTVAATVRDHIVPKSQGGSDEGANLQSLCQPCHDRKTMLEMRQRHYG